MSAAENRYRVHNILSNNDLYQLIEDWDTEVTDCDVERNVTDFRVGREGVNVTVDEHPDSEDVEYLYPHEDSKLIDLVHSTREYICLVFDNHLHQIWVRGRTKMFLAVEVVI